MWSITGSCLLSLSQGLELLLMGAFFYYATNSTNTSRMGRGTPHILAMGHPALKRKGKEAKEREKISFSRTMIRCPVGVCSPRLCAPGKKDVCADAGWWEESPRVWPGSCWREPHFALKSLAISHHTGEKFEAHLSGEREREVPLH